MASIPSQLHTGPEYLPANVHINTRNTYLTVGAMTRHWLVILLSVLLFVDYVILWARLPAVYGGMIAGTLPFSVAFVYAIHRIMHDPKTDKTIGLKLFVLVVTIYLIAMMYFATQIPKQKCSDV